MPSHPDRVRRNYEEAYTWVSHGWCSHCGYWETLGEHVCPDGTTPIDITPRFTEEQMRDLFEDGMMK